ncbi:MAG TPA: hypothetical protein VMR70_14645 [Flavisolibacter sp.]|nr:hypothetical protein [Flavisolibacter sp.]
MNIDELLILRKTVESCFGKKVLSHKECLELQNDLFRKTETLLGVNTIRRFFGLIKSTHSPSHTTLHTLAGYCGYPSVGDLLDNVANSTKYSDSTLLRYVVALFRDTPVASTSDKTFYHLVYLTVEFLNKHPELADPFQRAIAKTPNGQVFYFEPFVNIDKLDGYYGDGLLYYLSEKKTTEAQIFGNSQLALRYWLTNDATRFVHYSKKTLSYKLQPNIHPFVCGRHFGIRVLQAKEDGASQATIFEEARALFQRLPATTDIFATFPSFEFTFGCALTLAEQWQEALYYVEEGIRKFKKESLPPDYTDLIQTFYLFQARSLSFLGKTEKAIAVLEQIDTNSFHFLGKKFNTILYLLTEQKLKKLNRPKQLEYLIGETNFQRFKVDSK